MAEKEKNEESGGQANIVRIMGQKMQFMLKVTTTRAKFVMLECYIKYIEDCYDV